MSDANFTCEECGKEYRTRKPLENHMFREHGIGTPPPFDAPEKNKSNSEEKLAAAKLKIHDEVKAKYTIFLSSIGMVLNSYPATKADATVIRDNINTVAESVATAAETNAQIVDVVNKLVTSLSLFFVFATHGAMIQGIISNHTKPGTKDARVEVEKLREQLRSDVETDTPTNA